jgi:hypothetical protein
LAKHRPVIAAIFRVGGLFIGVPSFISFVGFAVVAALSLRPLPAADTAEHLDIDTYGLVALLAMGARGVAAAFGLAIAAMEWVFALLTVLALAGALVGMLLYLVGRGAPATRRVGARACHSGGNRMCGAHARRTLGRATQSVALRLAVDGCADLFPLGFAAQVRLTIAWRTDTLLRGITDSGANRSV